jgi:hypothetical protein
MRRRITGWEWIAIGGVAIVFILIRLPLYRGDGLLLGWHSDAAVFGLMAREMYEGTFHFFWWGQSYLGTLTQMFGVVGGLIVAPFGVNPPVGLLGMRVGLAIEWLLMIALWWLALRIVFTPFVGVVVALFLALGPDWLFWSPLAPRGAEMHLLLSGAILLVAAQGLRRGIDWFVFGLLAGVGWWMHQGVAFMIAAVFVVIILRSETWSVLRRRAPPMSMALRAIDIFLLTLLTLGALHQFVPGVPALFLHRPVAEPLIAWVLFRIIARLWRDGDARAALRRVRVPLLIPFAAGALVGYGPVIVARMGGTLEGTYGLGLSLHPLDVVSRQIWRVLREDVWMLIGGPDPVTRFVAAVTLGLLLGAYAIRSRQTSQGDGLRAIAAVSVLIALIFYVASTRAFPGAVRYLAPALVVIFAFAAAQAELWWTSTAQWRRGAAAVLLTMLIVAYAVSDMRLVDQTLAAREEGRFYTGPALARGPSFDPRPVIAAIERGGWQICYAPFAVGMNLEWLTDRRVRFISRGSFEPRRDLAAKLAATPGDKCEVTWDGEVRTAANLPAVRPARKPARTSRQRR